MHRDTVESKEGGVLQGEGCDGVATGRGGGEHRFDQGGGDEPKRDELLLYTVLPLPYASRIGLHLSTRSSNEDPSFLPVDFATWFDRYDRNERMCLVDSVLPAPDSPEMSITWFRSFFHSEKYASFASA
jgi:hypothetical protein